MEHNGHGIPARNANIAMAAITLVISILLIIATYRATTGYSNMRVTTDHYIEWQEHASDLQVGSDILTEQVRCFAETGKRAYLDGYFEEANVTRHRDNAVERIHEFMGETPAYQALMSAMGESVALMDREYYSMRLKIEACGYDPADYPEVLRQVTLSPEDAAREAGADAALFGHTHRPFCERRAGILCLNPGTLARGQYAVLTVADGTCRPELKTMERNLNDDGSCL